MLRGISSDLRLAVRSLAATPAVTLAAVLTLGLGIGATTAIFSVANGLVLRPLPVKDPEQLVTITSDTALRHGFQAGAGWSYRMWTALNQRAAAFDGAFAWTVQRLDLAEHGESQPVNALLASGDFFSTLGVSALRGRIFTATDDEPGGGPDGPVVVISEDLWQRRFNEAPGAIGSRLLVAGTPMTIVGVVPRSFRGVDVGQPFDVGMPFGADLTPGRKSTLGSERSLLLTVILRLKPGQTIPQATAILRQMQPQIVGPTAPAFVQEPFVVVGASTGISDRSRLRQQYERPLVVLSVVSAIVLLILCLNLASLFFARATARRRELSVRLAVGAPRWRVARQLFVESAMLGSLGAMSGTLFAVWASQTLVSQLPGAAGPVLIDLPVDARVLGFVVSAAATAVVLFGTGPALYATRLPLMEILKDEGRPGSGRRSGLLADGLVVTQVALSIVLLAAGGLFVRTISGLASLPLGFEADGLLVVTVNRPANSSPATAVLVQQRALEALTSVPGVTRAAGSMWVPLGTGGGGLLTDARGRRPDLGRQTAFNFVSPGWFATYRTALHAGREFVDGDREGAPRVAIVNETFRRTMLGDRQVVGDTIQAGPCGKTGCTVVGVVADTVYGRSLRDTPPPTVYVPLAQSGGIGPPGTAFRISLRTPGDPARLVPGLAAALRGVDPGLTFSFRPLEADLRAAVAQERLLASLAGFFGVIALLLSAIGLYGITSHAVTRRRAEIGIRLALGGQPQVVLGRMLRPVAWSVMTGALAGLLAAVWLSRFVAPLLYGLAPNDPVTLAGSAVTLVVVAAVAASVPARRALRIDPARVLREH